ncbi:Uncharacterized 10.3 kDa protein in GP2-GP6 intergenic region [Xenorhabdus bovienii]|uniref:Putative phage protein n=2 Tax=Xenorhabdus bovienii TaxID=40576 RepID=A0A0B6X788_XENBV|nr:Putative phage protein [Xenorhabdus bovienii]CDM89079.1 Uncharacterized 10.3 kDa protein in GP2-GP6 intergenic region [Xenorhabdus bovienii]CDM90398.1 Uncharacterized 10.3 kDa protein in GP2-GP6 intergenic region [Xenorhabdus bovienii]CDM90584.1 Uncharacterized 10.3 kDa protein in GP2-GP6 intergenic region [Xenorhabdus bovienii]
MGERIMAKFRKKPVVIDAFLFKGESNLNPEIPEWFVDAVLNSEIKAEPDHIIIRTLEGNHRADIGDWIIQGIKGELYPCKPEIFELTYEAIAPQSQ